MTEELKQAAQAALEQLEFLNACYPHKTAADAVDALRRALTQRPAAQGERDTGPRVLREVFALCEDTMDKMAAESTEFSRGRAFEAKGISRAIGTWFQDEYCGRSYMGEPSLPAPQQATPEPVVDVRCEGCGYMTHHREHMGCVRAAKQLTRPAPGVPEVLIQQVMEALRDGLSVCESVQVSRDRKISREGCALYAQTEEWCRWLDAEVGPKIRAAVDALAAAQAKGVV